MFTPMDAIPSIRPAAPAERAVAGAANPAVSAARYAAKTLLQAALLLCFLGALALPHPVFAQSADILVEQNSSRLLRLPAPVATVVVGEPSIADVSLESQTLLLLHGNSPGNTNLIALDAGNREILSARVEVAAAQRRHMFLHRGARTSVYDCRSGFCLPVTGGQSLENRPNQPSPAQTDTVPNGN